MDNNQDFPVLIGDVGGTNARFAMVRDMHSEHEMFPPVITNDHDNLQSAIEDAVLAKTSLMPKRLVMAIAAPVYGVQYQLTNARWNINPHEVLAMPGLKSAQFMNDFCAQALGVLAINQELMHKVGGGEASQYGTRVVLGPGTSFGISTIVHTGGRWTIIPSEGACADNGLGTGAQSARELQIQQFLNRRSGRQVIENTSSGPGLENLYQAICKADNLDGRNLSAAQISAAAKSRRNEAASEAIRIFSVLLGRIAGNLALNVTATGGVYVTGGMAHKMLAQIEAGGFRAEFENKPPQVQLVKSMATYFVKREYAALEGLANYIRTPDGFDLTHASAIYHAK